jgi:hypothetical protein
MGYLAAVCESLLQSHVPGHLVLLPSLPQVMASQGGSIAGLRARGNAVVSVSWMPLKKVKDSKAPINGTRNRGGKGHVHKATILFRAPHPWFNSGVSGPNGGNSNGPIVEDQQGFFSFSKAGTGGGSGPGDGSWTEGHISEVIIVYPESKRPLRLAGSYRQEVNQAQGPSKGASDFDFAMDRSRSRSRSKSRTLTAETVPSRGMHSDGRVSGNAPTSTKKSAKLGTNKEGERAECARVIPALSVIPSANITIAANPKKYTNIVPAASKRDLDEKSAPRNYIRQGIGLQIFDFPCRIVLRS